MAACLSIAFGLLLLVSHVARAGHLLLVAHERCAEHGELVHGDEHGDRTEQSESPTASTGDSPRVGPESADGVVPAPAGDSHEHCDPLAIEHAPQLLVAIDDIRLLDGYLLPWSLRPGTSELSVELLLLAPKNSPPA